MVSALKMASAQLAALGHAEDLGHRPRRHVALQALHGARAEDEHAMLPLAAQHLLPRVRDHVELGHGHVHGEDGRGGVADDQTVVLVGYPGRVGHPHARGGAVPGEDHVTAEVHLGQIGDLPVVGRKHAHIGELELLGDVGDPALPEALPGQHVHAAGPEQRPEGHLHRPGVGGRHEADAIVVGNAQKRARTVEHLLDAGLALFRPVRTPDESALESGRAPTRALGAGAGGEAGVLRTDGRVSCSCDSPFSRSLGSVPALPAVAFSCQ